MTEKLDAPFLPNYELAPDGQVPVNVDKMRKMLTKLALSKMKKRTPMTHRRRKIGNKWF